MLAFVPGLAMAQDAGAPNAGTDAEEQSQTIVVTGTLIRGIAPVGNNVIGVSQQKIETSGAATSTELLARLPQVGYFGNVPFGVSPQVGSNASNPISRPNLRNLPGAQTSGGAQTLILIDGHRVVGAGTQQIGVDPDIIAPGAVQRVEALTDGGSAVYGSDAIGGVINFITRKRFDGVEANARVGLGNDLTSFDGYVTAGKDWGTGGLYVSYNYAHHDEIFGRDRDYIQRIDWNTGVPSGRFCASPNVNPTGKPANTFVVSGSGLAAGGPITCDPSDDVTYYPRSTLHNVYARFNQDLADWLSFDVTAMWARRETLANAGTLGSNTYSSAATGQVTLAPANPYYRAMAGFPDTSELVTFNYAPAFGAASMPQRTVLDTLEIVPQFTVKPFGDWQVRALGSYGWSKVSYANRAISSTAQSAYLGVTVNPFDLTGPSSSAADLAKIVGYDRGFGRNEFFDYRAIADGTLFTLPAGPVKAAFGGELMRTDFKNQSSLPSRSGFTLGTINGYVQTVHSVFGEAQVPVIGEDMHVPLVQELTLSISGRYDKYNDFGDTFNPKYGVTWKPIPWITIRGNWGKSFTAPSPTDQLGTVIGQARAGANSNLTPAPQTVTGAKGFGQPAFGADEAPLLLLNGSAPGLQPQKATNWSIGTTIQPPVLPGLTLTASFYRINLEGTLGRPVGVDLTPFYQNFPDLYLFRPTGAQVRDYLANGSIAAANTLFTLCNPNDTVGQGVFAPSGSATGCASNTVKAGALLDTRARNLGTARLSGLDFSIDYTHETSFGSWDASLAGNLQLMLKTKGSVTSPVVDQLNLGTAAFKFQASLGANIHNLRIQGTWNHVNPYSRSGGASVANFGQGRIAAFNTFDAYLKYDFKGEGAFKDLALTLNVQNVFDTDPPVFKSNAATTPGFDPSIAFTFGRYFQLGLRKKF